MSAPTPPAYSEHRDCLPAPELVAFVVPTAPGGFGAWTLLEDDVGPAPLIVSSLVVESAGGPLTGLVLELGAGDPAPAWHRVRLGTIGTTVVVVPLTIAAYVAPNTRLSAPAFTTNNNAGALRLGLNVAR